MNPEQPQQPYFQQESPLQQPYQGQPQTLPLGYTPPPPDSMLPPPPQQPYGYAQPGYPPQQPYGYAQPGYPPQQPYGYAQPGYPPQQLYAYAPGTGIWGTSSLGNTEAHTMAGLAYVLTFIPIFP
jgi:hypothetical protein